MNTKYFGISLLILFTYHIVFSKGETNQETKKETKINSELLSVFKFRSIGPALTSGRVADIAINEKIPGTYYVAAASGGVWKTKNWGTTFKPIFDNQESYSIGCISIDPNNPHTIWIGTGENNNQRSVAYGDGVYKSTDGGKTWNNMGLKTSEHIGMIKIDPKNSNRIFVAAYGPLWSAGGDRGLYLTEDGGKTWSNILSISEQTGINEVHFDPRNSDIIYATAHQRRRKVFTYISGGPESAIYKSIDGGKTFVKLENGLPKGDIGRISLAIEPQNPDIIYTMVEAGEKVKGIYQSKDRGASWNKINDYASSGNYYVELICDPIIEGRIYSMDTWAKVSNDGGESWKNLGEKQKHVDNHCMWINPKNKQHYLMGCDGGVYESFDAAKTWQFKPNLPITQFYKVALDNSKPFYNVAGGTQDNFSLMGPSQTNDKRGVVNSDWFVTKGGDGFESAIDPKDPNIVYAQSQYGYLVRYDKSSGENVDIKPKPKKNELPYRWNWDAPLIISPHNNKRLYFAANKLFRSDDRGNTWATISNDLTQQIDRNSIRVMGKVWSIDAVAKNKSTTLYGNIVALSESPLSENLIYVGTDDGLIQITPDGGGIWSKTNSFDGVPANTYVNMLLASQHHEDNAYAIFNNHKNGDFKPYVYRTFDKGKTWTSITGNLPKRGSVYCIAEDHVNPNLLFVGTEFGVFTTIDGGKNWVQLKDGIPTVAIRDMAIQKRENDLVVATFGRGFYVLDNYAPLRKINENDLENETAIIFEIKEAKMYIPNAKLGQRGNSFQGASYFSTPNPEIGAEIRYYIKNAPKTLKEQRKESEKELLATNATIPYPNFDEIRAEDNEKPPYYIFEISDNTGTVIRRIKQPAKSGIHRFIWDLRYEPQSPVSLKSKTPKNIYQSYDIGRMALPGKYSVKAYKVVRGKVSELTKKQDFSINFLKLNKQMSYDRVGVGNFAKEVSEARSLLEKLNKVSLSFKNQVNHFHQAIISTPKTDVKLIENLSQIDNQLNNISIKLFGDKSISKHEFETAPSINNRLSTIVYYLWRTTANPTSTQHEQLKIVKEDLSFIQDELKLVKTQLKYIQNQFETAGVNYIPGWMPKIK